jgi:hypothetical protein
MRCADAPSAAAAVWRAFGARDFAIRSNRNQIGRRPIRTNTSSGLAIGRR